VGESASSGIKLKIFSGKQAKLNRLILQIFGRKGPLIAYDVWRFVVMIKDFGQTERKTVYERVDALSQEGYIIQKGTRLTQPGWPSELFELTRKGKAALKADKKSMDQFLATASEEELQKFIDIF
jgi:DNA-binding PadR family transcriptional regulator